MEKIYFTGEMIAKNQEAIPFVFVAGPWKLPGNSLAFMAVFAGAWSGMGNAEAVFLGFFNAHLPVASTSRPRYPCSYTARSTEKMSA